jgi:uncharacterized membrane protein YbhN (UPF0104 family)
VSRFRALVSSRAFKVSASIALLAVLLYETDLGDLGRVVGGADPRWAFAGFAAYLSSQVLSAFRWQVIARPLGFTESFGRFLGCFFAGMYLSLFGPSTLAGDVGRSLLLAGGRRRGRALTTVVAHRAIGFVALACIAAAALLCLPHHPVPRTLYWAAWSMPFLSLLAWWWGPLAAVARLPKAHRVRRFVERDLRPYRNDRRLLAWSFTLAVVMHLVQVGSQALLALALGLHLPWSYFLIFVPVVNVAAMLPITVSGIGIREAGYWYFLDSIGADGEEALALGLIASAVTLAAGLTGAPFLLATGKPAAGDNDSEA